MAEVDRVRKPLQLIQRASRRDSPRIKYYFVLADKLRATKATTLPALQSLLADPATRDWIVEKEMNFDDACRGKYVDEFGTVSHRWLHAVWLCAAELRAASCSSWQARAHCAA